MTRPFGSAIGAHLASTWALGFLAVLTATTVVLVLVDGTLPGRGTVLVAALAGPFELLVPGTALVVAVAAVAATGRAVPEHGRSMLARWEGSAVARGRLEADAVPRTFPAAAVVLGWLLLAPIALAALAVTILALPGTAEPRLALAIESTATVGIFGAATILYAIAVLALIWGVDEVVGNGRWRFPAMALVAGLAAVGLDLLLFAAIGLGPPGTSVLESLAIATPSGAYRTLVLETALGSPIPGVGPIPAAAVGLASLAAWLGLGLVLATVFGEAGDQRA